MGTVLLQMNNWQHLKKRNPLAPLIIYQDDVNDTGKRNKSASKILMNQKKNLLAILCENIINEAKQNKIKCTKQRAWIKRLSLFDAIVKVEDEGKYTSG